MERLGDLTGARNAFPLSFQHCPSLCRLCAKLAMAARGRTGAQHTRTTAFARHCQQSAGWKHGQVHLSMPTRLPCYICYCPIANGPPAIPPTPPSPKRALCILISSNGRSFASVLTASNRWTVFMPLDILPKMVCLPSRNGVGAFMSAILSRPSVEWGRGEEEWEIAVVE